MLLPHLGVETAERVGNSLYHPNALLEPVVKRVGNSLNSLHRLEKGQKNVDAAQTTRKPLLLSLSLSMSSSRAATDESG